MAFKQLINTQLDNAFRLIGDLGETITFVNVETNNYNFETGEVSESISDSISFQCIVTRQYAESNTNPRIQLECIIKLTDVGDSSILDNYDTVTLRSKQWTINNFEDNGFSINLKLSRKD